MDETLDWDNLDPYKARKHFGLHGGSSNEELLLTVLALTGLPHERSNPAGWTARERDLANTWAVGLGSLPGDRASTDGLKSIARRSTALIAGDGSFDIPEVSRLAERMIPGRSTMAVLSALGIRVLLECSPVFSPVREKDSDPEPDRYELMADANHVDEELFIQEYREYLNSDRPLF